MFGRLQGNQEWSKAVKKQKIGFFGCLIWIILSLCACAGWGRTDETSGAQTGTQAEGTAVPEGAQKESVDSDTGFVMPEPGVYDSADTAVVVDKNQEKSTITFLNLDIGRKYTLSVEGTTMLYDKYGAAVSLEQIKKGDVVDITFLKSRKRLNSMQLSPNSWTNEAVTRYTINMVRHDMTIGENVYKLSEKTLFFSDGRPIEAIDLNPADVLTVKGLGSDVLSIEVVKGHGYLRLANDENFVGGWIEIGQTQIQQITQDMLLTVPEGSYQVSISHKGGGGTKGVVINRNEEVSLDIGDLEVPEAQYGLVLFSMNPSDAKLYVDGTETDPAQPVSLEYGIHQIIAKSEGYKSLTSYIRVNQPSVGIDVTLDSIKSEAEKNAEENKGKDGAENRYKVHVDAPEGAEVYLDGNYVGISPASFNKTEGAHIITLRRSGYETRSYTVQIDSEEKDLSYSFADLVPSATTAQ